jgi:spore coat polysaccharide biosynthesis protein SpsF
METIAVVETSAASGPSPGIVLRELAGRSVLAHVVRRAQSARRVDEVVVSTTYADADDEIVAEAGRLDVTVFRGDEGDLLGRLHAIAQRRGAQRIVRLAGNGPLVDADLIDRLVEQSRHAQADYVANNVPPAWPRGMEVEVYSAWALARAHREATDPHHRRHVGPCLLDAPDQFDCLIVHAETDHSGHLWSVETPDDLAFLREVFRCIGGDDAVRWTDVIGLLTRSPALGQWVACVRPQPVGEL